MKHLLNLACFFIACCVLASCNMFNRTSARLAAVDSIMEKNPDSAYAALNRISGADITTPADSAYYGLLYSQARYKLQKRTDTSLISRSIDYYQKHHNPALLQRCYLYMGGIMKDNNDSGKKVILQLEKAERLIPIVKDTLCALKIYEWLFNFTAYYSMEKQAENYAHKLYSLAFATSDSSWHLSALEKMTWVMLINGNISGAKYYLHKRENYLKVQSRHDKSSMYSDFAMLYLKKNVPDYKMAEFYANKALTFYDDDDARKVLLEVYLDNNNSIGADSIFNKTLQACNITDSAMFYGKLSRFYARNGMFEKAYAANVAYDSICDIIENRETGTELEELYLRYNTEVIERKHRSESARLHVLLLSLAFMATLAVIYLLWKVNRKKLAVARFKELLAQTKFEICELNEMNRTIDERNEALKLLLKEKSRNLKLMRSKLQINQDELIAKENDMRDFEEGLQYLYYVMMNESISQLGKKERDALISCYRIVDETFVDAINNLNPDKLTTQEKLYCVLRRMGKSIETIQNILQLSDEALRKTRSRALSKLKNDGRHSSIVDNII